MKSFLTIRGNLIFINLIVIALILWLTISFLYIAVAQRVDANNLQANVQTERLLFKANRALTQERNMFTTHLNSPEPSVDQRGQQVQALKSIGHNTDSILDAIITQINDQLANYQYERMATNPSILEMQLKELEISHARLLERRSHLISQQLSNANAGHPETLANVELANEYAIWDNISSGDRITNPVNRLQIATQSRTLEQRFDKIVSLSQASENSTKLLPIAVRSRDIYRQSRYQGERKFHSLNASASHEDHKHRELKVVILNVSSLMTELGEITHLSMDEIAKNYGIKSTRNLIIDIFLIFLCLAITIASVAISRKVKRYAYYDSLTQLPNRMNFESTLRNLSTSDSQMQAVIFIDLDRFKAINDNYGHSLGDELLKEISIRLNLNRHHSHLVARMGGDEFAVLVPDASSTDEIEKLALQISASVQETIMLRGLGLKVGASVGYCISPFDCKSGVDLVKNADIAMYHSKAHKLEGPYRYNEEIANDHAQRIQLELDLKKGIDNGEFVLVYQPKVCTQTGKVNSVEALVRWQHPERGFVSPGDFIPVAEDTGLMGSIGHWVLNEACRELSQLQKSIHPDLQVAVNISTQQFGDENFIDDVFKSLSENNLKHQSLELEVTESIVMSDVGRVVSILNTLKDTGIAIAIDDFGTGYSSLQYLQELPLDTLKIDRAFIVALNDSDPTNSVANSIVQLARLFNLQTVAEGVETDDQNQSIRSLGVHHIQGYLYSKPVSANELAATIKQIELQSGFSEQHAA